MSRLFDRTTIDGMALANRFIRSATWDARAGGDGSCTPELIDSVVQLVEGGVGLVIAGGAYVSADGQGGPRQMGADRIDRLPGLLEMTKAVHSKGGKIALQIFHAGCHASSGVIGTMPIGPSPRRAEEGDPCCEMTGEDIDRIIASFRNAAALAKEAHFDAIQVHAAHGLLLSEFLSPFFNKRSDEYGGSIENRVRIVLEVLQNMRKAVGKQYPLLIKINSEDYLDGGLSLDDMLLVAAMLEDAGIDAIEVSGGTFMASGTYTPIRQGRIGNGKEGYYLRAVKLLKKKINVPIILVGGIRSFENAEQFVDDGAADYISLCRPLICEPGLVNRWKSGDLRPSRCLSDNLCLKSIRTTAELRCGINSVASLKE